MGGDGGGVSQEISGKGKEPDALIEKKYLAANKKKIKKPGQVGTEAASVDKKKREQKEKKEKKKRKKKKQVGRKSAKSKCPKKKRNKHAPQGKGCHIKGSRVLKRSNWNRGWVRKR